MTTRASTVVESAPVPGLVSVVIVNYRGADDTSRASPAWAACDWPAELTRDRRRRQRLGRRQRRVDPARPVPTSRSIESQVNTGFAGGCNLGVAHVVRRVRRAHQQRRPTGRELAAAPRSPSSAPTPTSAPWPARSSTGTASGSTTSAGSINFVGQGYKPEVGQLDDGQWRAAPRRAVLHRVGRGHPARVFRRARRLRRALLHVLRGRRLRLADEPGRPPGALRAGLARLPQAPRRDRASSATTASSTCSPATAC